MLQLTVLTRPECHLCQMLVHDLQHLQQRYSFAFVEVNVDSDAALAEDYGVLIPVVLLPDGRELCHYRLDEKALLSALGSR